MKRPDIYCGTGVTGRVLHPRWDGKEFPAFGVELKVSGGREMFARRFRDAIAEIEKAVHRFGAATLQVPDDVDVQTLSDQWDGLDAGALAHVWHAHAFGKTREMTALALPHSGQTRAEATLLTENKDLVTAIKRYIYPLLEIVNVNIRKHARSKDEFQAFQTYTKEAHAILTTILEGGIPSNQKMTTLMFDLEWIARKTGRHSHFLGLLQSINTILEQNKRVLSRRLVPGEMLLMSSRPLHAREVLNTNETRKERPSDIIWFSLLNGKPHEVPDDDFND
jgi:hypothetical protein